ncbi:MAG: DUF3631 domain-containing protein [Acidimicrobiales bacterium]
MTAGEYGGRLTADHAAKLECSAISAEVAEERGYVTADTKAQLERFGFGLAQRRPPALVIPLHGVTGELVGHQMRSDDPRMRDGKPAKYETKAGQKMLLDVPPRVHRLLGNPEVPLYVTEGPIKADAAATAGLACVALLGVWSWRGRNGDDGLTVLADWEYVHLQGRRVVLAFDSDVMLKTSVYGALARLSAVLAHRGAEVAYVYLPGGEHNAKVGLDDWFAAGHGVDDLAQITTTELRRPATIPAEAEPADTFDDVEDESGAELADDVAAFLNRFVVFANTHQVAAVAAWVLHTHALAAFDQTPRLVIRSPEKQCGKSRLVELMAWMCKDGRMTISVSAPYLFRLIDRCQPTMLVDEVDTIFGNRAKNDSHEDLRGIINSGFRRGATVGRIVEVAGEMVPTDFATFSPVALAGIGSGLPDTVTDRSVIVALRRRGKGEKVEQLRQSRVRPEAEDLGRRCAAWAHRNVAPLTEIDPVMPNGIEDRPADTWAPLLAIADASGGQWPERLRTACVVLNKARAKDDPSSGVRLLTDLKLILGGVDHMFSANIVDRLTALPESPWAEWHNGKGFTTQDLGRKLKDYGITSHNVRAGAGQAKGYTTADLADAFERYLGEETDDDDDGTATSAVPVPAAVPADGPLTSRNAAWDGGTAKAGVGAPPTDVFPVDGPRRRREAV